MEIRVRNASEELITSLQSIADKTKTNTVSQTVEKLITEYEYHVTRIKELETELKTTEGKLRRYQDLEDSMKWQLRETIADLARFRNNFERLQKEFGTKPAKRPAGAPGKKAKSVPPKKKAAPKKKGKLKQGKLKFK